MTPLASARQDSRLPPLCLAALLAAFAFVDFAMAFAFPPLTGRVVDSANIIPQAVSDRVTAKLASLEAESGIQLVVVTLKSLEGDYIEHYACQDSRSKVPDLIESEPQIPAPADEAQSVQMIGIIGAIVARCWRQRICQRQTRS